MAWKISVGCLLVPELLVRSMFAQTALSEERDDLAIDLDVSPISLVSECLGEESGRREYENGQRLGSKVLSTHE